MGEFLANLINSLDSLDWRNLPETHKNIESLLQGINRNRYSLSKALDEIDLDELHRKTELSHETSTHYKWFLHKNQNLGYSVWLHEYKNAFIRRHGYAEVPHNHRYWFSSLILKGGFIHLIYDIVRNNENEKILESINKKEILLCDKGYIYTFDNNIIHSLVDIKEPTLTFVIRSRGIIDYSESFDIETRNITKFVPFSARLQDFKKMTKLIQ